MSEVRRVHAVDGLFAETPEGPRLLGSKCGGCQTSYFPRSEICHNPDCNGSDMQPASFGPHGTLWSYAIQNYPPPPPFVTMCRISATARFLLSVSTSITIATPAGP